MFIAPLMGFVNGLFFSTAKASCWSAFAAVGYAASPETGQGLELDTSEVEAVDFSFVQMLAALKLEASRGESSLDITTYMGGAVLEAVLRFGCEYILTMSGYHGNR